MERVNSLSTELFICIAKGAEKQSTAHAYELMDARTTPKRTSDAMVKALAVEDLVEIGANLYNAFQLVNDNDRVNNAISQMRRFGALGAALSGSGPSVFGIFYSIDDAENAMNELVSMGYEAFVVSPVR
jgi:4-diphosphocytidyl-2-C-methyl-D-erythritol kinase